MGTFIYPGTPDLIPCRWENSFLTFLKTAVLTNMSSCNEFPSPGRMLSVSLAIATLSKCWYNVHNYKRQRNDCLKHFKGLDFCYNSVSTLSLSILSDLDELQQTEFARCLAPTLNNRNIVGIAKCLARFVAAFVKMLFRDADFNHQRPRPASLQASSIQILSQMKHNQEQKNEA